MSDVLELHGRYYEEFCVGFRARTLSRTITEADVVNFLGISGIFQELNMSTEYFREHSVYGSRVAPGPLTFSIQEGLVIQLGLFHHTAIALIEVREMLFPAPVICGDTLHAEIEVTAMRETSNRDRGIVTFRRTVRNQKGDIVLKFEERKLFRRKASSGEGHTE